MAGDKTMESSEAYLDSLLKQMISSTDAGEETKPEPPEKKKEASNEEEVLSAELELQKEPEVSEPQEQTEEIPLEIEPLPVADEAVEASKEQFQPEEPLQEPAAEENLSGEPEELSENSSLELMEDVPMKTESVPIETEPAPIETESVPMETESVPMETEPSQEEDLWEEIEEDGSEDEDNAEEWEDDTYMKEDKDFDLLDMPEASELDKLEESDINEEFHMEDQGILDEIEHEFSDILPKKKEKRERRQKKQAGPVAEIESQEETGTEPVMEEVQEPLMDHLLPEETELSSLETENARTEETTVTETHPSEKSTATEPSDPALLDGDLSVETGDVHGETKETQEVPGPEETHEMEKDGKTDMDEHDGFDLESLFAASDDTSEGESSEEHPAESEKDSQDNNMEDLLGMLDMGDGEHTQEDAPDIFAMDEGDGDDIFALDNGNEEGDIFALDGMDGMEEPEHEVKTQEEKLPDPDNVFAESLAAVGFENGTKDKVPQEEGASREEKAKPEKDGKGFFAKLFGNIVDKKSKRQFEAEQKAEADAEFKRSEKQRIKEGRLTEEERAAVEAKEAEAAKLNEEKAAAKAAKKKAAEEKKAEKEAKKKAKREALEAEAAKEVDEGRINRVGAGIVFAFFGAVAAGVVVGTNLYTYSQSISRATEYFDVQKYNNAYKEVYGLDIKEKDETIYDKIMTVMFVNKELNSYNNFYAIGLYPEALDSLLKGLERYDKYLQDAESLGIESDLNYVRRQILGELKRSYSLSEKDALELNSIKDPTVYSESIRQKALAVNE